MSRLSAFAVALALVLAARGVLAQSGVAGDWNITFDTPQGPQTVAVTLKLDGDKATGQLSTPMGSMPVAGTATTDGFDLSSSIDLQGTAVKLALTGKVTGDTLAGSIKAGDFGEFPFTGKRPAQAVAGAGSAAAPGAPSTTAANATDASGKWNIVLNLAGNAFPMTATFKQDGDAVSGSFSSLAGDVPVTGTMVGKSLTLQFMVLTPQGSLPVTMTGDLSADGFAGKASIAGLGDAPWTGKRAN